MAPERAWRPGSTDRSGLVTWDRTARPLPFAEAVLCLWSTGFIANRSEVIQRISATEAEPDHELLERLYQRYGAAAASHVAGTLTWILWDGPQRRLVAARDRAGIHGLFYAVRGDRVGVAGEVESLLGARAPDWNPRAIVAHLHGQAPPPGETFYSTIHALEPGELLTVGRTGLRTGRYWSLEPGPALKLGSDDSYAEAFREVFFPIVAEYLPGRDRPAEKVGVTLSGGLDSTAVAAAVREVSPRTELTAVRGIAPELPEADESRLSAAVCRRLGSRDVTIRSDRYWPLRAETGPRTSRSSPFVLFFTELWDATLRAARRGGVDCLFSGAGGDHLFGGNGAYADLLLIGRGLGLGRRWDASLSEVLRGLVLGPIVRAYLTPRRDATPAPVPWLGARSRSTSWRSSSPEAPRSLLPGRRQRLRLARNRCIVEAVEAVTRQASGAGIDLRHPLLDHRLAEFAVILPSDQSLRAGEPKHILRNAFRGYLPDEVLDRRYKIVPSTIADLGFREREQAKVWGLMTDMRAADLGFVDEKRLRDGYREYLAGRSNTRFWFAITLEAWLRQHFA